MRLRQALAWAWLGVVGLSGFWLYRQWPSLAVETSVLALLPQGQREPVVEAALERLAGAHVRRMLSLVGHADERQAAAAADAYATALRNSKAFATVTDRAQGDPLREAVAFFTPHRGRLLSPEARERLGSGNARDAADQALQGLLAPAGPPRALALTEDPLGLFSDWLLKAGQGQAGFSLRDGRLALEDGDKVYFAVIAEAAEASPSLRAQAGMGPVLAAARAAALAVPGTELLRSGFLLHAAEAASQAQGEISVIGTGSTLGVLALTLFAFRSLLPLFLVLLPVAVGCLLGIAATGAVYPKVHVITLVFGSSIIGIAEDYGTHFLSGVFDPPPWSASGRLKTIFRGICLALLTSLLGYAAMLALPFPALRQMGLFSMVGLFAAWTSTVLWMPVLGQGLKPGSASIASATRRLLQAWPRWDRGGMVRIGLFVLAGLALAASLKLSVSDDIRHFYAADPGLSAEQAQVDRLLQLPSPGQFFVLQAADEQGLLEKEETLLASLAPLQVEGLLKSAQGLSRWVPSLKRQEADLHLQSQTLQAQGPVARLGQALEEPGLAKAAAKAFRSAQAPLETRAWLAQPASLPLRPLWLGKVGENWASVVTLSGIAPENGLSRLQSLPQDPGVLFVDNVASISQLLARYRRSLSWVLAGGFLLVVSLLAWVYGRQAWRALAPTLLGAVLAMGVLGVCGLPFNLFTLLALLLLLGMGIDFGIYMQESSGKHEASALMAIMLSAATTVLAFGFLGFSATPALRVFGLTLSVGLCVAWLSAPYFTRPASGADHGK